MLRVGAFYRRRSKSFHVRLRVFPDGAISWKGRMRVCSGLAEGSQAIRRRRLQRREIHAELIIRLAPPAKTPIIAAQH
jgi:hypothetical protein